MEQIGELVGFLGDAKAEVRRIAVAHVASYTCSVEGRQALLKTNAVGLLTKLTGDLAAIAHDAYKALINLSEANEFEKAFLASRVVPRMLEAITGDPENKFVALQCALLNNLTKHDSLVKAFIDADASVGNAYISRLVFLFLRVESCASQTHDTFEWLGPTFANITRIPDGRNLFLDFQKNLLVSILPSMRSRSVFRRGGAIGVLRNCLFEDRHHEKLLKMAELDLLPTLCRSLVNPSANLDKIDLEQMLPALREQISSRSSTLQLEEGYEHDAEIRKMLVDALAMLTATRFGRDTIRASGIYPIFRELEKVEQDGDVKDAIWNLVQPLLMDEKKEQEDEQK